jgi:hypothetical protein
MIALRTLLVTALLLALPSPAVRAEADVRPQVYCHTSLGTAPQPRATCVSLASYSDDVCRTIERLADEWSLPSGYFARLIWQESRFDANAVSPAGAEGIAQFMPGTARIRGLRNSYNPAAALAKSAEYLRFLTRKFGNLGLAAAAYNSGEGRTARFLNGSGYMPGETEDYVQIVTGYDVVSWLNDPPKDADYSLEKETPFQDACLKLAKTRTINTFEFEPAPFQPWGVQLAADFRRTVAKRIFDRVQKRYSSIIGDERPMIIAKRNASFGTRLRYRAQIGRETQKEAIALCKQLQKAGGVCMVMRN